MSNFLAVDTSSKYLTVLAKKGGKVVIRYLPECAMQHSVMLMDEIDGALDEAGLIPDECDFFAAVTGPGSFTGIRIGIATVKGFAFATGKKMLGVTSFDLIAYNVADGHFCAVIDAGRGFYYACEYKDGKAGECRYVPQAAVESLDVPLYGIEDLPLENYKKLQPEKCLHPAICGNEGHLTDEIYALYVRKSQAEEMREKQQNAQ